MAEEYDVIEPIVLDKTVREGNDKLVAILENITKAEEKANEAANSASNAASSANASAASASSASQASTTAQQVLRDTQLIANSGNADLLSTQNAADIIQLNGDLVKLENDITIWHQYPNLYDESKGNRDKFLNGSNGGLMNDAGSMTTDYIEVKPNDVVYFECSEGTKASRLWWYDSNKTAISMEGQNTQYTAVPNSAYFRLSFGYTTRTNIQIELNSKTEYHSYGGYWKIKNAAHLAPFKTIIKAVAHQGYNELYPRNSLLGVIGASKYGFNMVEGDVQKTLDGVYVMWHNDTSYINSNNVVNPIRTIAGDGYTTPLTISTTTYSDLLNYDFGAFKDSVYANTKICKFEDWVKTAKMYGLGINIDHLLNYTSEDLVNIAKIVRLCGMGEYSIFNIVGKEKTESISAILKKFNVGIGLGNADDSTLTTWCQYMLNDGIADICNGDVYFACNYTEITDNGYDIVHSNGFKVLTYTIDSKNDYSNHLQKADGITSDSLNPFLLFKD